MNTKTDYSTTKKQAEEMGRALVARLNDRKRGWKLHVWENLGWHYQAVHEQSGISVSPGADNGTWHAMLNPSYAYFYPHDYKEFRSPHKAVEHVISSAIQFAKETNKHVDRFKSYLS